MVFNFLTFDVTGENDINACLSFSSSDSYASSSNVCLPLGNICTKVSTTSGASQNSSKLHLPEEDDMAHESITWMPFGRFSIQDLHTATDNFSIKNLVCVLGSGRCNVYKGRLDDGSLVAIKRCNKESDSSRLMKELHVDWRIGKSLVQRNLLRTIGFCEDSDSNEVMLVHPFMANRSLASYLRSRPKFRPSLDWPARKHIARGVARGLLCLHNGCSFPIVHGNINPSNILLDQNFEPFITDFSLSKILSPNTPRKHEKEFRKKLSQGYGKEMRHLQVKYSDVNCGIYETRAYMPPEYVIRREHSVKTDVFAFGVMLFELVCGCHPWYFRRLAREKQLPLPPQLSRWSDSLMGEKEKPWEGLVDCRMQGGYDQKEVEQVLNLAFECTRRSPDDRPDMLDAFRILDAYDYINS